MEDPLTKARHYHDQAENMEALARLQSSKPKRQIMDGIAELYYLLHDKFVELNEPAAGEAANFRR